jgi:hypothetical protein
MDCLVARREGVLKRLYSDYDDLKKMIVVHG